MNGFPCTNSTLIVLNSIPLSLLTENWQRGQKQNLSTTVVQAALT
jgi:hypothetical protein